LIDAASGGSYDWAKAVCGVKYAYALELRPSSNSDDSRYGFMLPVDSKSRFVQIMSTDFKH